jgi:hypothetical protein
MQPLDKTRRNQLERAIKSARGVAEAAARAALEQIGVGETAPPSTWTTPAAPYAAACAPTGGNWVMR